MIRGSKCRTRILDLILYSDMVQRILPSENRPVAGTSWKLGWAFRRIKLDILPSNTYLVVTSGPNLVHKTIYSSSRSPAQDTRGYIIRRTRGRTRTPEVSRLSLLLIHDHQDVMKLAPVCILFKSMGVGMPLTGRKHVKLFKLIEISH